VESGDQELLPTPGERRLAGRIFSTSAQLVGVCLTVIGLFRVVSDFENINSVADNLMAVDALIFLGSCLLSYLSLRSLTVKRSLALEQAADVVFPDSARW
jgi:hypothetical protein